MKGENQKSGTKRRPVFEIWHLQHPKINEGRLHPYCIAILKVLELELNYNHWRQPFKLTINQLALKIQSSARTITKKNKNGRNYLEELRDNGLITFTMGCYKGSCTEFTLLSIPYGEISFPLSNDKGRTNSMERMNHLPIKVEPHSDKGRTTLLSYNKKIKNERGNEATPPHRFFFSYEEIQNDMEAWKEVISYVFSQRPMNRSYENEDDMLFWVCSKVSAFYTKINKWSTGVTANEFKADVIKFLLEDWKKLVVVIPPIKKRPQPKKIDEEEIKKTLPNEVPSQYFQCFPKELPNEHLPTEPKEEPPKTSFANADEIELKYLSRLLPKNFGLDKKLMKVAQFKQFIRTVNDFSTQLPTNDLETQFTDWMNIDSP